MTLERLRTLVTAFRQQVRDYRDLLLGSRDLVMPEIVRNGEVIEQARATLNTDFGRLQRYIRLFGNNPRMNDGVNPHVYDVYSNAFSADILLRAGPSLDAVLPDLDYIAGRLNGMTEDEFAEATRPRRREEPANFNAARDYWRITNPFWIISELGKIIWRHKLVSFIITVIGLFAIDYSLAWRNAVWVRDFISHLVV